MKKRGKHRSFKGSGWFLIVTLAGLIALLWGTMPVSGGEGPEREEACVKGKAFKVPSYECPFGNQLSVEAESADWRIRLLKREHFPECGYRFLFQTGNKQTGTVSQIEFCDETVQVDEIDLNGSTALILGRLAGSASVVNVVELTSGKIKDHFACYFPAPSPDAHFLAFVKDFPGHPGPLEVSYEYVVYDLAASPAQNRANTKAGIAYDPGWPVYPPGATNAASENLLPAGSPVH